MREWKPVAELGFGVVWSRKASGQGYVAPSSTRGFLSWTLSSAPTSTGPRRSTATPVAAGCPPALWPCLRDGSVSQPLRDLRWDVRGVLGGGGTLTRGTLVSRLHVAEPPAPVQCLALSRCSLSACCWLGGVWAGAACKCRELACPPALPGSLCHAGLCESRRHEVRPSWEVPCELPNVRTFSGS